MVASLHDCTHGLTGFDRRSYNPNAILELLGMVLRGLEGLDHHVAIVCASAIDHLATYVFEKSQLEPTNPYVGWQHHSTTAQPSHPQHTIACACESCARVCVWFENV